MLIFLLLQYIRVGRRQKNRTQAGRPVLRGTGILAGVSALAFD
jgi:hypothetical protein